MKIEVTYKGVNFEVEGYAEDDYFHLEGIEHHGEDFTLVLNDQLGEIEEQINQKEFL